MSRPRLLVPLLLPLTFAMAFGTLPAASAVDDYTISGHVRTTSGVYIAGGSVEAYNENGEPMLGDGAPLESGDFEAHLPGGTYTFVFRGEEGVRGGDEVLVMTFPDVLVDADREWNPSLPETPALVRGVESDGTTSAPSTRVLECTLYSGDGTLLRRLKTTASENSDDYPLTGFVVPADAPAGSGCQVNARFSNGAIVTKPLTLTDDGPNEFTIAVPEPVTVTGRIIAPLPIDDGNVYIDDADGQTVHGIEVGPDGRYSVDLFPGRYTFDFYASRQAEGIPNDVNLHIRKVDVQVDGDTTLDASLPYVPLDLQVVDTEGQIQEGRMSLQCLQVADDGPNYDAELSHEREGTLYGVMYGVPSGPGWSCAFTFDTGELVDSPLTIPVDLPATPSKWTLHVPTGELTLDEVAGDNDGVPDDIESQAPNNGDGNNDGTPDADQTNVTSLPANGEGPAEADSFVTVAGPPGSILSNVSTLDPSATGTTPPPNVTLPSGLASFTLNGVPSGSDQTVSIYAGSMAGVTDYAKFYPSTQLWELLPADRVSVFADRVEITLTDGGTGDDDGAANGSITDPGGPAKIVTGDTTAPVVTGRATTRPNGYGWYAGDVRIDWSATDPSGVKRQPADTIVTGQGANVTAQSPEVCDNATPAPNCGRGSVTGLKIDKSAPTVSVKGVADGATYTLGNVPAAGCHAYDGLSGLRSACKGVRTGGNANGVGQFTYAASGIDKAGNARVVKATYRVVYRFDGFLAPLNNPPSGVSVFKAGSTAPVGFTVKRANGTVVTPVSKPVWVVPVRGSRTSLPVNEAVSNAKGSSGSAFTWKNNRWQYDWSTKGVTAGYLYRIGVRLDDGTTHYLNVGLR